MSDEAQVQRGGDRRTGRGGYDGPERRVADRRAPQGAPAQATSPEWLSDLDLARAYQRVRAEPGNPEADALRTEIKRRGLDL